MRVVLGLVGSRGDVDPGLVLARALHERGHDVRVGVAPNLLAHARRRTAASVVPLGVDSGALLASPLVREEMRSRHPARRVRALREVAAHGWTELREGLVALAADADVLLTGLLGQEVGSAVAELHGSRFAALHYAPVRANRVVDPLPGGPLGTSRTRAAAWRLGERVRWDLTRAAETHHRAALGLARPRVDLPRRLRERGALEIQAYDAAVLPALAAEWGARRPLTGWLRPVPGADGADGAEGDPAEGTDAALESWLRHEPVYVGFGSMPVADPARLLAVLDATARHLDRRVLLTAGWNEVGEGTAHVLVRRSVDHARVLPRCAAAVHHGGAGTVGATLHAGIGSVVAWYSADQPMWATVLRDAGVGRGFPVARLDADRLVDALGTVLGDDVRVRAAALRERLVPPDVARAAAVAAVERAT